jgi:hypothetical protein
MGVVLWNTPRQGRKKTPPLGSGFLSLLVFVTGVGEREREREG